MRQDIVPLDLVKSDPQYQDASKEEKRSYFRNWVTDTLPKIRENENLGVLPSGTYDATVSEIDKLYEDDYNSLKFRETETWKEVGKSLATSFGGIALAGVQAIKGLTPISDDTPDEIREPIEAVRDITAIRGGKLGKGIQRFLKFSDRDQIDELFDKSIDVILNKELSQDEKKSELGLLNYQLNKETSKLNGESFNIYSRDLKRDFFSSENAKLINAYKLTRDRRFIDQIKNNMTRSFEDEFTNEELKELYEKLDPRINRLPEGETKEVMKGILEASVQWEESALDVATNVLSFGASKALTTAFKATKVGEKLGKVATPLGRVGGIGLEAGQEALTETFQTLIDNPFASEEELHKVQKIAMISGGLMQGAVQIGDIALSKKGEVDGISKYEATVKQVTNDGVKDVSFEIEATSDIEAKEKAQKAYDDSSLQDIVPNEQIVKTNAQQQGSMYEVSVFDKDGNPRKILVDVDKVENIEKSLEDTEYTLDSNGSIENLTELQNVSAPNIIYREQQQVEGLEVEGDLDVDLEEGIEIDTQESEQSQTQEIDQQEIEQPELSQLSQTISGIAQTTSEETGTGYKVHEDSTSIENEDRRNQVQEIELEGKTVEAYLDPDTGEIVYLTSGIKKVADERGISVEERMEQLKKHEVVTHIGIKNLYQDNTQHDQFHLDIYKSFKEEINKKIGKRYKQYDPNTEQGQIKLAEEYLANLAEDTDLSDSNWDALVEKFTKLIRKIAPNINITKAELRNILRTSYKGLKERGVLEKVESDTDTKFSIQDDANYLELAKEPEKNRAELQKMVDTKANNAGYNNELYHGTRDEWTTWDFEKAGGLINLAENEFTSSQYAKGSGGGRKLTETHAIDETGTIYIPKEIDLGIKGTELVYENQKTKETFSLNQMEEMQRNADIEFFASGGEVKKLKTKLSNTLDLRKGKFDTSVFNDFKGLDLGGIVGRIVENEYLNWSDTKIEFIHKQWKDEIIPYLKSKGYDSIYYSDDGHNTVAVFDSNQIKSADPVTRDDAGNIIPLSQRFDTTKEDIRYSIQETEPIEISLPNVQLVEVNLPKGIPVEDLYDSLSDKQKDDIRNQPNGQQVLFSIADTSRRYKDNLSTIAKYFTGGRVIDRNGKQLESFQHSFIYSFKDMEEIQNLINNPKDPNYTEAADFVMHQTLYSGSLGHAVKDFKTNTIERFIEESKKRKLDLNEYQLYAIAKHAKEANEHIRDITSDWFVDYTDSNGNRKTRKFVSKQTAKKFSNKNPNSQTRRGKPANDAGSGMTDSDADIIISRIENGNKAQEYKDMQQLLVNINKISLYNAFQAGLIDAATYTNLTNKYKNYIPLKSDVDPNGSYPMTGKGYSNKGKMYKFRTGRKTLADNIIAHSFDDAVKTMVKVHKQAVMESLFNLASKDPDTAYWKLYSKLPSKTETINGRVRNVPDLAFPQQENVVTIKNQGKTYYLEFDDQYRTAARAINTMGADSVGWFIKYWGSVTNTWKALTTGLNPEFWLGNFPRDIQGGLAQAIGENKKGLAKGIMRNLVSSLRASLRYEMKEGKSKDALNSLYEQYLSDGGKTIAYGAVDYDSIKGIVDKAQKLWEQGKVVTAVKSLFKHINNVNEAIESAMRFSAYRSALDIGLSRKQAAQLAKRITVDFDRKGFKTRTSNALFAFSNVGFQSLDLAYRNLKNPKYQAVLGGLVAIGFLNGIAQRFLGGKDDETDEYWYDKQGVWQRGSSLTVMSPEQDGSSMFSMPLAMGYRSFFFLGDQMAHIMMKMQSGDPDIDYRKLGLDTANSFLTSYTPVDTGGGFRALVPTIAKPFYEASVNEDWLGNPIYPEPFPNDPDPGSKSSQFYSSVSPLSKAATRELNALFGGNEMVSSGITDFNPEKIDHVVKSLTSGVGKMITNIIETGEALYSEDKDLDPNRIPIYRKFAGREVSPYANRNLYERLKERLDSHKAYVELLESEDKYDEAEAYEKKYEKEIEMRSSMDNADKKISKLYKRMTKAIQSADNPLEARQEQEDYSERMDEYRVEIIKEWKELLSQ